MHSPSWPRSPLATVLAAGLALLFAVGALVVSSVFSAAPSSAHVLLVKVTPADGAQLTTAPTDVVLEFNESVSMTFATVAVKTATGVTVTRGKPTAQVAKITQQLNPDLAPGAYRVAFRVISDDGHPVSGESTFTLGVTSGAGTATSVRTPSSSASSLAEAPRMAPAPSVPASLGSPGQGGWVRNILLRIAGVVGLVVIGASFLVWSRRRR